MDIKNVLWFDGYWSSINRFGWRGYIMGDITSILIRCHILVYDTPDLSLV